MNETMMMNYNYNINTINPILPVENAPVEDTTVMEQDLQAGDVVEAQIVDIAENVTLKVGDMELAVPKGALPSETATVLEEGQNIKLQLVEVSKEKIHFKVMKDTLTLEEERVEKQEQREKVSEDKVTPTQVMKNTKAFVEHLSKQPVEIYMEQDVKESLKEVLTTLTKEDLAQLEKEGVDVEKVEIAKLKPMIVATKVKVKIEKQKEALEVQVDKEIEKSQTKEIAKPSKTTRYEGTTRSQVEAKVGEREQEQLNKKREEKVERMKASTSKEATPKQEGKQVPKDVKTSVKDEVGKVEVPKQEVIKEEGSKVEVPKREATKVEEKQELPENTKEVESKEDFKETQKEIPSRQVVEKVEASETKVSQNPSKQPEAYEKQGAQLDTRKVEAPKEEVGAKQEEVEQTVIRKEVVRQEVPKEATTPKREVEQATTQKEVVQQEVTKEAVAPKQEVAEKTTIRKEEVRQEVPKEETAPKQEAAEQTTIRKEVVRQEAPKEETATPKQEAAEETTIRKEVVRQEAPKEESAPKQEVDEKETTIKKEEVRQEVPKQAAKETTTRKEVVKQETPKETVVPKRVAEQTTTPKEVASKEVSDTKATIKIELPKTEATEMKQTNEIPVEPKESKKQENVVLQKEVELPKEETVQAPQNAVKVEVKVSSSNQPKVSAALRAYESQVTKTVEPKNANEKELPERVELPKQTELQEETELLQQENKPEATKEELVLEITKVVEKLDVPNKEELVQLITKKLETANIPFTRENVKKVLTQVKEAAKVEPVNDQVAQYVLRNDTPLTLENIYKAEHSVKQGKAQAPKEKVEPLTKEDWKQLYPQVQKILDKYKIAETKEKVEQVKWLIESKLPVTKETLEKCELFRKINEEGVDFTQVIESTIAQIENMENVPSVSIEKVQQIPAYEKAVKLVENIQKITPEAVEQVVEKVQSTKEPITIDQLVEEVEVNVPQPKQTVEQPQNILQQPQRKEQQLQIATHPQQTVTTSTQNDTLPQTIDATRPQIDTSRQQNDAKLQQNETVPPQYETTRQQIEAKLQLEEIRLKMTVEVANRFYQKGIEIETKPLTEVVERLRQEEISYYQQLASEEHITLSTEQLEVLETTTLEVARLKEMPSTALGLVLTNQVEFTVADLNEAGSVQGNLLRKAEVSYDTMMTKPRGDLGDSMKKAFKNVDHLLEDLELEPTTENRRAVRILGYNEMELTKENISNIKALDAQVNHLIEDFHPRVALSMIKEGKNPIDVPIPELNEVIDQERKELDIDEDTKYSKFLYDIERNEGITKEERTAFIGIYRMLHQVEKSEGRVIGALVKQNQEITLKHLLTAGRTIASKGIDKAVNDDFGGVASVTFSEQNILEQVQVGFAKQNLHTAMKHMDPTMLKEASKEYDLESMTLEEFAHFAKNMEQTDKTPQGKVAKEQVYYEAQLENMKEALKVKNEHIKVLEQFNVPTTTGNMVAISSMLSNGSDTLKQWKKQLGEEKLSEKALKALEGLDTAFSTPEDTKAAFEEAQKEVGANIDYLIGNKTITAKELTSLKQIKTGMSVMKQLSRQECFLVPLTLEQEETFMRVEIKRASTTEGTLHMKIDQTKQYNMECTLKVEKKEVTWDISADEEELKNSLNKVLTSLTQELKTTENGGNISNNQLYRVASRLLHTIKNAKM